MQISKSHSLIILLLLLIALSSSAQKQSPLTNEWPAKNKQLLKGFDQVVSGSALDFFPFLKPGNLVAYVGENQKHPAIEIRTEKIPEGYAEDFLTFIWHAAISRDTTQQSTSEFEMTLNGESFMTIRSFEKNDPLSWQYTSENGIDLAFVHTHTAQPFDDEFGYFILNIPKKQYTGQTEYIIGVKDIKTNPRDYIMAIQNPVVESFAVFTEPAIIKTDGGPKQSIKTDYVHLGKSIKAQYFIGNDLIKSADLRPGPNSIYLNIDPIKEEVSSTVKIELANKNSNEEKIKLSPVRPFEVYFLPHSHVDIGFTHKQQEVAELQWKNLDLAIDLTEETKDYPDGSQYKWNAEISWVLDGYLEHTSPERKAKFIEAVNDGRIGIDALYGSVLTGLQREEELFYNTLEANRLIREYGFDIQSAMISDVPGYTWGTVPALAQTGIKYFSVGPNHMPHLAHGGYQVGATMEAWGDVPMYWKSPSGQDSILFWMSTHGYSWFHSWSTGNISHAGGDPILNFLDELNDQKYPYDMVQLRYNIGNDNGPPDPEMPDFFKAWNEKYEWPKFRIATTLEMMKRFEKEYGHLIPEATGDFTPYWEDGASSSAVETSLNRNAADQLVQAETIWGMYNPSNYPRSKFDDAWTNIVLFSEHTWGANISKSDPDSEFTKSLWSVKSGFAEDAKKVADELVTDVFPETASGEVSSFQVVNSLSWERSALVELPDSWQLKGEKLLDDQGNSVPSQRLKSGKLVFKANGIPGLAAKTYKIKKGKSKAVGNVKVGENSIENELIYIQIDKVSGAITSIKDKRTGQEFINQNDSTGFNTYWYSGIITENLSRSYDPDISIEESGPLVGEIKVNSKGAGANSFSFSIRLVSGSDEISLTNVVDKLKIVEDENVRFSFPFNVDNGQVRMDIPWTVLEPGVNQLKGANKNFYSVQRFVDISNETSGITMTTEDAPIWEIGGMYGQQWMSDMNTRPWLPDYIPSQRLYAWVMNNIWFVNYKAHQEGPIPFRFTLKPHGKFSAAEAKRFGTERTTPLLLNSGSSKSEESYLIINGSDQIVMTSLKPSMDGEATMIRLFNSSNESSSISLKWKEEPGSLQKSSPLEEKGEKLSNSITLVPWEILTIRVE